MATVSGYTAEKLEEIMDNTIVSGAVVGDNLILTKQGGGTVDAGHVRGDPGPVDLEEWLDYADPPGTPKPYEHSVLPARHGWCDAETEYDGTTYPKLAAIFLTGANCVNGACADGFFRLPNHKGRFMVARDATIGSFDTLRETGGSKDAVNVTHNHTANQPGHDHTADQLAHDHGGSTTTNGLHSHAADGDYGDRFAISHGSPQNQEIVGAGAGAGDIAYTDIDDDGSHFHTISPSDPAITIGTSDPAITVDNAGVDGTDKNLPPYRVVNVIMRLT